MPESPWYWVRDLDGSLWHRYSNGLYSIKGSAVWCNYTYDRIKAEFGILGRGY